MHLSFQTTVTLLLFCYVCLMERTTTSVVGATKVTRTLYVTKRTGATLTRERRQTPEKCTDNIQTRTNTYTRQATRANEPTSDSACSDWCLTNVRCAAAYWLPSSDRCLYTTDPTHRTRGLNGATYYKIILRCPKHYACKDRPCQRGTCVSSVTKGIICKCPRGWAGFFCERVARCSDNPCENGGTCSNRASGGILCSCRTETRGDYCELHRNCTEMQCQNKGVCNDTAKGAVCTCSLDFIGKYCERKIICTDVPCQNHGTCIDNAGGGVSCKCDLPYRGHYCERNVKCSDDPCHRDGTCTMTGHLVLCECSYAFRGDFCERLVRCSDSPCYHNAKCKDLSDSEDEPSVKCTCAALYGGRYCEGVNKTIIYSGSATISLLLAMCLGIWYYRRRQKMKRLEHEQLQRRVEAERRRKSKGPKSRAMKKLFKPLEQLPWDVGL